jgi:hypothetical protein
LLSSTWIWQNESNFLIRNNEVRKFTLGDRWQGPARARTLSEQSGGAEETVARTSATQEIGAISEAMEVLSAEISHH